MKEQILILEVLLDIIIKEIIGHYFNRKVIRQLDKREFDRYYGWAVV